MDLATLVGIIGAWVIIVAAMIMSSSVAMFVDVSAMLIVLGGSTFACMMKFELGQFLGAGKTAGKVFSFKLSKPDALIDEVVELADEARKNGLLALEGKQRSNPLLAKDTQLLAAGHDSEVVRTLMSKDTKLASERHDVGIAIFKQLGDLGPAMVMLGTLIGLVAMFSQYG